MEGFLTFAQVRARFGLGGTADNLVLKRMGQVATREEIIAAAEDLSVATMTRAGGYSIVRADFRETDDMPAVVPHICPRCGQPSPGQDEPPF